MPVTNNKQRVALRPKDKFENVFLVYSFPYLSISGGVLIMRVWGKREASVYTNQHRKGTTIPTEKPTEKVQRAM
jgi:hypothetical protein